MTKRVAKSSSSTTPLPADYAPLLADIKARVQAARIKAGWRPTGNCSRSIGILRVPDSRSAASVM